MNTFVCHEILVLVPEFNSSFQTLKVIFRPYTEMKSISYRP